MTIETDDLVTRIERLLNERHANLVDATTAVVAGLHDDLDGLRKDIEAMRALMAAPSPDVAALRHDLDALAARVTALEGRQ